MFPAVDLLSMTNINARIILIDKEEVKLPAIKSKHQVVVFKETATQGVFKAYMELFFLEAVANKRMIT